MFETVTISIFVVCSFSSIVWVVVTNFIFEFEFCFVPSLIWVVKIVWSIFRVEVSFLISAFEIDCVISFITEITIWLVLSLSWLFKEYSVVWLGKEGSFIIVVSKIVVEGGI